MRSSHDYHPLGPDDIAAGSPLPCDLYDHDGAALLPAGTTLRDDGQHAFLFGHFRPARREVAADAAHRQSAGEHWTLERMGLSIGATIGIRRRVGTTRLMQRCRLIGHGASQAIFLEPLHAAALEIARGDDVEAIAIGRAAIFRFVSTVDAVRPEPTPFVILSPPGFAERLRTRAEPRVPMRIAARFSGGDGNEDIGIVRDVSLSGMSLAARQPVAIGAPLRIWLPYNDDCNHDRNGNGNDIRQLALSGTVRHVHPDPAAPALSLHHIAYDGAEPADLACLKGILYDRLVASPGAGDPR
ncbi:PilZ domain-containing protein [Burkholderia guangdongensis]|uniref:PilZ domain-containing protein n=1 Tax=Burkholderia guangdongensis TaxID=1792500 RepID=UPI0015C84BB2|nr:PilZ domain-containing protein [Burkholderia guangdongensis]